MKMRLQELFLTGAVLAVAGFAQAGTDLGGPTSILPDFRPLWSGSSIADMRMDVGLSRDRLVSCEDWTQLDPNPPTGMRVLSFRLASPNLGQGDLRLRRRSTADGIEMYQTISQMSADGVCSAVEIDGPIAVIPNGPGQAGRWLPLAKFALYKVAEDGGIGERLTCQVKRWCCLSSAFMCPTRGPCPRLPSQGSDDLDAGTFDGYPFHWTDQFLPIPPDQIPSGTYWFEDEINPAVPYPVMWESDYSNNSMFLKIAIDQEAGTVQIVEPPDGSFSQCPVPP